MVGLVWADRCGHLGIIGAVLFSMDRNSLKAVRGIPKTADTVKEIPTPSMATK